MKTVLTPLLLLCLPLLAGAQALDSTAIKQVDSLILVSRALTDEQDFAGAHAANGFAEQMAAEACGKESLSWGNTCFNHGRVLYFEGRYAEAEPWYLDAKSIRERWLGKAHADYAKSLNNLAIVYDAMGQYEKAEPLYLEAIAIREQLFGKQSAAYANALCNLADMYKNTGDFEKSEVLNLEAKDIREQVLGKAHPDYASSLNNLANLYFEMGNYQMAKPLYLESKAIREAAQEQESVEYARGLDNLGVLYQFMGEPEKPQQFFAEAIDIFGEKLGKDHPEYILSLNHLAGFHKEMGQYEKAEPLFLKAQAIGEKVLGKEHFSNGLNLQHLVELYLAMGQYEKAKSLSLESNHIFEKSVGRQHAYYVEGLDNLAQLHWATGDFALAEPLLQEASQIRRTLLLQASHYLSERELAAYSRKYAKSLSADFSFAQVQPSLSATCYDDILFHKGFLLNTVQQVGKLASADPLITEKHHLYKSYHRLLATEYAKPIEERSDVPMLEAKANSLEKELARNVAGLGQALRPTAWQAVQATLSPGEAAIEFVHYQYLSPGATDSTMYVALVLLPKAEAPLFIPLFEEKQLAALLPRQGPKPKAEGLNALYGAKKTLENPQASSLYSLIWQPLEACLGGVETVYFSPTGLLYQLNLNAIALPGEQKGVLADRYGLVELGSTRQLAEPPSPLGGQELENALLFGGISYDLDSTLVAASNNLASRNRGLPDTDTPLRSDAWGFLPWTEVEVVSLQDMLVTSGIQAELLQGHAATEAAFRATSGRSPSILHFATHGFFFADPPSEPASGASLNGNAFRNAAQPMMRSGLVLAGGNHVWRQGKPISPGTDDGILTAYEISQMDLRNTELVVLSACETGLGDVQGNEGVYGLQRAFKMAGAKYLVMSLWQVPDYQTQQLMSSFYGFWMDGKMAIPEAFRSAQKAMRAKFGDPFYWAGFVLVE